MKSVYVIKDLESDKYYDGTDIDGKEVNRHFHFHANIKFAMTFDSYAEALNKIEEALKSDTLYYLVIEKVYMKGYKC